MKSTTYRIESLSPLLPHRQFTPAPNLSACMAKCAALLKASHRILAIHKGARRLSPTVVENMISLAARAMILDWLSHSLDMDPVEAETLLGDSLPDQEAILRGLQLQHLALN